MSGEGDVVDAGSAAGAAPAAEGTAATMTVDEALRDVLKKALIHDGLVRGVRESVKALDRRQAHLCVMAESTDEQSVKNLVEALCNEHNIHLIKVPDGKELGKMVGLCKIDREGEARKIVRCAVAVVKDFGEDSVAMSVLMNHFKTRSA
eukprot:Unigene1366_Nuclearia_a/m.4338 Unigene1366_Nuclearia_a/g.4338  ORF Unigene1366_Nuclearia_a/g.4338 Unigene1366_Nuclearia_a/m.4338 type:complete len:149 (-) Unigene1366_Nuclearia_a:53-499(-)